MIELGRIPARLGVALAAVLLLSGVSPVAAAPKAAPDFEGGSPELLAALEQASRGYSDARAKLDASLRRQADIAAEQREVERQVQTLSLELNAIAADAYRGGSPDLLLSTVQSGSLNTFLDRASILEQLSGNKADTISAMRAARKKLAGQKEQVDGEERTQRRLEETMGKRKADAERALKVSADRPAGGAVRAGRSAPRRSDGSLAPQSCALDDPTTGGCLTARTINSLEQAKAAGFTRFVACFRQASFGEHGKGRACDFSASEEGFGGVASGDAKRYGDNLANYFVANADELGVLYVIWFERIWLPGVGWRAYTRGGGDPSSDHTNHVHLSVQ